MTEQQPTDFIRRPDEGEEAGQEPVEEVSGASAGETSGAKETTDSLNGGEGVDELLASQRVYDELKSMARRLMTSSPPGSTLQSTALVHETYLRLQSSDRRDWKNMRYFYKAAADSMHQVWVDQIRRKKAQKRGGDWKRVDVEGLELGASVPDVDAEALHEALRILEVEDPRGVQVVELRFFVGLSLEQIAGLLEVSVATVQRDWRRMKSILQTMLSSDD
ncbi:MAG: ECF-type sigma factor [Planctomycetota bacterium]